MIPTRWLNCSRTSGVRTRRWQWMDSKAVACRRKSQVAEVVVISDAYSAQFHQYTITTGADTNGDTVANDRPSGVGRNTARGRGFWNTDLRAGWIRPLPGRPVTRERAAGGGAGREAEVFIAARNVLNQPQFGVFNGVLTSPLFGQPVSARNPRRIEMGLQLRF